MTRSACLSVVLCSALAVGASAQKAPSVSDSFRTLLDRYNASAVGPFPDGIAELGDRIDAAPAQELADALPLFFAAALSGKDDTVKSYGVMALFSVAHRLDCGDDLLRARIGDVAALLALANPVSQRMGAGILDTLVSTTATPPAEAFAALKSFLKRTDRDLMAQAGAVSTLMAHVPGEPEVLQSVTAFLSRPLDPIIREGALRAVSRPGLTDVKLIDAIAASLNDPVPETRTLAIGALSIVGPQAIAQAEPALLRVARQADEPDTVKAAARKALAQIGRTIVVSGLSVGMAQPGVAPATLDEMLDKPIPNVHRGSTRVDPGALSLQDAFALALGRAGLPGGLELIECAKAAPRLLILPGSTVRAALEQIRKAQPDLELKVSQDGVVKMLSDSGHADVLSARNSELTLTDLSGALSSLRQILDAPEVKARVADLKLQERLPDLGFSQLPKPGATTPPPESRVLHDTSVEEALDIIAKAGAANRIWVYEEDECAEPHTFTISFPVR